MSNLLLAFSFILHIVTIMMVVILYQRQGLIQEERQDQDDDSLFEQLELYAERIDQGNRELINQLKEHLDAKQKQLNELVSEVEQLKHALLTDQLKDVTLKGSIDANLQDAELDSANKLDTEVKDDPEAEKLIKHKQALDLSNQGFSIEKIAQILNLGKGEVQLLLNFHLKKRDKQ